LKSLFFSALSTVVEANDFPLHAPILFDIIQPGIPRLRRVLCEITGRDKDVSAITVQKSKESK
jgi:hypothetical protein